MTSPSAQTVASLLTYCTNVHPGETLDEVLAALRQESAQVAQKARQRIASLASFPIGLRLSAIACAELQRPERLATLRALLGDLRAHVFTLNGFPYGAFHGRPVKAQVYLPDWTSDERVVYTEQLFSVLRALLPQGYYGSVSTVPGQFKAHQGSGSRARISHNLLRICAELAHSERTHGVELVLALEPEPGCMLETTEETLNFFETDLLCDSALDELAKQLKVSRNEAERLVRRHLGVCLDTCHAAVEFEPSWDNYQRYQRHGIRIGKVQISAGLQFVPATDDLSRLRAFDEAVYLHQVVKATAQGVERFDDLPEAIAAGWVDKDERWRVHFHVPLFTDQYGDFSSTRNDAAALLRALAGQTELPHLEVETYTWSVLPELFRDRPLPDAIDAELAWAYGELTTSTDRP